MATAEGGKWNKINEGPLGALNSKRYHQYVFAPSKGKVYTGMEACLDGTQGDSSAASSTGGDTDKDTLKGSMKGAIMIMLFLLNPVLGEIANNPSHKRYCDGITNTLEVAFNLASKAEK